MSAAVENEADNDFDAARVAIGRIALVLVEMSCQFFLPGDACALRALAVSGRRSNRTRRFGRFFEAWRRGFFGSGCCDRRNGFDRCDFRFVLFGLRRVGWRDHPVGVVGLGRNGLGQIGVLDHRLGFDLGGRRSRRFAVGSDRPLTLLEMRCGEFDADLDGARTNVGGIVLRHGGERQHDAAGVYGDCAKRGRYPKRTR